MERIHLEKRIAEYISTVQFKGQCCFQPLILDVSSLCHADCNCHVNDLIHYIEEQGFNACFDRDSKEINAYVYDLSILKH
ncbi:hypothetical protein M445_12180 [Vibrio owensii 47666-1]|nr:hypothetical protein M445_12180 [Vibrio owensii 47666-1]